jgi:hypothetical protein
MARLDGDAGVKSFAPFIPLRLEAIVGMLMQALEGRYAEVTGQTEEEAASENDSGDAPEVMGDFAESGAEDLSFIGEEAQENTAENAAESATEGNE